MATELTMTKSHSPHEVKFKSDTDPHFAIVEILNSATGEIKASHYILKSDVPQWLSYFESQGFTIKNSDNG